MRKNIEIVTCDICGKEKRCRNVNTLVERKFYGICEEADGQPSYPEMNIDICPECSTRAVKYTLDVSIDEHGNHHNTYGIKDDCADPFEGRNVFYFLDMAYSEFLNKLSVPDKNTPLEIKITADDEFTYHEFTWVEDGVKKCCKGYGDLH